MTAEEYYSRRAREEREKAAQAVSELHREAHLDLAEIFEALAREAREKPSPSPEG